MILSGIQKLSLVDFPGKVACTVFTGGCNLRCPYCHNSELIEHPPRALEEEELLGFLEKRRGMLDGVCVTGGEPCIHPDLPQLLGRIKALGYALKLDTNGCFPELTEQIVRDGLADYLAVDVKNAPSAYAQTTGMEYFDLERLERTLWFLMAGSTPFELRTTLVWPFHTKETILELRDFLLHLTRRTGRRIPAYYLQAFTDRETVPCAGLSAPSGEEMERYRRMLEDVAEQVEIRGV